MKKNFLGKFICLVMAAVLVFSLAGCNNGANPDGDTQYYTVTFDVQGHGTAPKTQAVDEGEHAGTPKAPAESGYRFAGWYKESECTNKYNFATETLTQDITLYAKWFVSNTTGLSVDKTPTIYLAGDSTVQAYSDSQYIAGWGQYLDLFLDEDVTVVNCARGGRSSRSFINEDRLFTNTDGTKYSFTENGGKSIEECIQEGDYLFVQFGHNDDASKGSSAYSYMYDRMVPLGEADEDGIYPVTAPSEMKPTTYLPEEFLTAAKESEVTSALAEIAKYGDEYYAYGEGTYKWYLKQYVDLAREKGAIPVLITPVARVKFNSDGTLASGAGYHGENFAYVEAVRQLAEEEKCLLIDNFDYTKKTLEASTAAYSDFLMAIVPNSIDNGEWPTGYDNAYQNSSAGYEKMEGTHYNKYGAYLTAAYVAESIIKSNAAGVIKGEEGVNEYYNFGDRVLITPSGYVDPSNRIGISKVAELEGMFTIVEPTNPDRTYTQASVAIAAIEALAAKGDKSAITEENYEEWKGYCAEARAVYESLNYDLRDEVTNLNVLEEYEAAVKAARPKPQTTVALCADSFVDVNTPITVDGHTFTFDSNLISYGAKGAAFNYNDKQYAATTQSIRLNGNGGLTGSSPTKYIEFEVTGPCTVTMVASGGGSTTDVTYRHIMMLNTDGSNYSVQYDIPPSQVVVSQEIEKGGTYRVASTGSNIDLYYIIIEYYA